MVALYTISTTAVKERAIRIIIVPYLEYDSENENKTYSHHGAFKRIPLPRAGRVIPRHNGQASGRKIGKEGLTKSLRLAVVELQGIVMIRKPQYKARG